MLWRAPPLHVNLAALPIPRAPTQRPARVPQVAAAAGGMGGAEEPVAPSTTTCFTRRTYPVRISLIAAAPRALLQCEGKM